jgi:hypothetical protein
MGGTFDVVTVRTARAWDRSVVEPLRGARRRVVLIPPGTGTTWDHYFIVLMPLAVAAWPVANVPRRVGMIALLVAWELAYEVVGGAGLRVVVLALWVALLADLARTVPLFGALRLARRPLAPTRRLRAGSSAQE